MNHPWQQPIRPLEYRHAGPENFTWYRILFIRPMSDTEGEWEALSWDGLLVSSYDLVHLREVAE